MTLKVAISAVILLLLAILVSPQFAPQPPVIDERQLVEPVVPIIVPEPIPDQVPDTGLLPPPPLPAQLPAVPPAAPRSNCNGGTCPVDSGPAQLRPSGDGGNYREGLFPRLRARRGR